MNTEKRMWNEGKGGEHWLFIYTLLPLWVVTDVCSLLNRERRRGEVLGPLTLILLANKREK